MPNIPIDTELEQGTVSVPIEDDVTEAEAHERGVSAVLVAKDRGDDPVAAYVETTSAESRNQMDTEWTEKVQTERMSQIEGKVPYEEPVKIIEELTTLEANLSGEVDQGNYVETIKSMPMSAGQKEMDVQREAVYMQMRETMATTVPDLEEMDFTDVAAEFGGVMIPKRRGYTLAKLMRGMGFEEGFSDATDTFVDPVGTILKLRNVFWGLDEPGQVEFLNVLAEHLPAATDNKLIQADILDGIIGGDFDESQEYFFEFLDTIDVTLLAGGTIKLLDSVRKGGKIINTARRMKEPDVEADMIEDAVKNPDGGAKVGVTQADVGDHLNPLVHGDNGIVITGASEDQAAAVQKMMEIQEARFKAVTEELQRTALIDDQQMDSVIRQAEIKKLEEPGVIDAKVSVLGDQTGFNLSWTEAYFDKAGALRRRSHESVVDFTVNDIGELKAPLDEWTEKFLLMDPNARMSGTLRQWFVSDVETLSRAQEMTAKAFDGMMRDAFGQLNKRQAGKVDRVLRQGAKDARTYTFEDLVAGDGGVNLTPKEAQAYLGARNVVDKLYLLKNKQLTDQMLAQGVRVWDGPEGIMPVRTYNDANAASTAWKQVQSDSFNVLIPERGLTLGGYTWEGGLLNLTKRGELTKEMIDEAYTKGYVLARNQNSQSYFRLGENSTQWAFVRAKNTSSPRGKLVLNRIDGYMPKQRTGSYWFIKRQKKSGLSGASDDHTILSTEAYSDTEEAAEAWRKLQDDPDAYDIVFDRELTADQRAYDVSSTHGGMYAGARKSTELEYVGRGDTGFTDSFEALQHYINHIGRQYPASLYRIGAEQRLVKIANSLGIKAKNLSLHNVLEEAEKKGILQTSKEYKMLKDIHDQVSFVNMIPTNEELKMSNSIRKLGLALDKPILNKVPGWERVPKFFYQKAAQNAQPVNIMRGLTFNHLLGMYNPAQVLVQFSGSLIAMAADPIGYPKHVAKMVGWGTLDQMTTDPIAQKKLIQWMKSNDMADYADEYDLWRKSGYFESVVQGNADYASVFTRNMPYNDNVLRKAMANHTLFYKMGELANTRVAFATSVSRYRKVHNVTKLDPEDKATLDEISLWAEKYRLNMSRANQSDLNKGWKGAPLQFQQVISKYFEKVLPQVVGGTDEFTGMEKLRLAAIPTALTGSVGIPFGQDLVVGFLAMLGIDETELSEEETQLVKYGVVGWATNGALDLNVNFSDRMTLGGDVIRNIYESITTGKATWQWLGASGTVIDRYARNMQYLSESLSLLPPGEDEEPDTIEDLMAYASILKEIALDIPTVSRNWKQYSVHMFGDNPRFEKDGKYMWEWETMNKQTALLGVLGFQPTEMTEMYELSKELKGNQSSISQFGDTDADVIIRLINTKLLSGQDVKTTRLYSRLINNMLHKYGPINQRKLLDQIWERMNQKQMDQGNLMYKAFMEELARQQKGLDVLNTLYNRKIQETR